jgi:integrase
MARRAEGFSLYRDPRTSIFYVRFTHGGRRHYVTTGERDHGAASGEAARLYAEIVSGRWRPGRQAAPIKPGTPFLEIAAIWLADIEPTIDPRTFKLYRDGYMGNRFVPFFVTIDRLTSVGAEDYIAARLRQVTRETLKKELSVLRRFSKWAAKRGFLPGVPEIETPGRRVIGTPVAGARKRQFQVFTAKEVARIIAHLPEHTSAPRARLPYAVRAWYILAWETALRPRTLAKLRAPDDYRKGTATLVIRDEADKSRFGRELPLSDAARDALDGVCPEVGLIFGDHDRVMLLRRAAKAAGIDEHRASRISDYDFRHSRLTHLGQHSDNLAGVMYLAGHKQPATTARYLRPQKDAAAEVLRAAAAAGAPAPSPAAEASPPGGEVTTPHDGIEELWRHSGGINGPKLPAAIQPPERQSPESSEMTGALNPVRGGGIEPPWLLTASTSS